MKVTDFDFALPAELIAQTPAPTRDAARLLVLHRQTGRIEHTTVSSLHEWLAPGDVVVVNDTRVFPARLLGARDPSGGAVECLLLRRVDEDRWEALVHPGQKLGVGGRMRFPGDSPRLHAEILERKFRGRRELRLWTEDQTNVEAVIDAIGHIPLPPYIRRADTDEDRARYQTVFAAARGSVAAPTAGLHFTQDLLQTLRERGIGMVSITLHVGYGTFKPVQVDRVEDHLVDPEPFTIGEEAAAVINRALDDGRRIVAVGTTTTRALEHSASRSGGRLVAGRGMADLFIYPGFEFRVVKGLLTNFHLPRSSLLMLVSAFGGPERVLAAYREAVARRYRFYSYGDAMLII